MITGTRIGSAAVKYVSKSVTDELMMVSAVVVLI